MDAEGVGTLHSSEEGNTMGEVEAGGVLEKALCWDRVNVRVGLPWGESSTNTCAYVHVLVRISNVDVTMEYDKYCTTNRSPHHFLGTFASSSSCTNLLYSLEVPHAIARICLDCAGKNHP